MQTTYYSCLIAIIFKDIFCAGGETSATTIDWTMAEIMKDSRVMKKHKLRLERYSKFCKQCLLRDM